MLKRVLSVALFLTLVFSLVPMANAASDISKVEFVAVVNSDIGRADLASITAPGGPLGILIPGTNNNLLTITAPAPQIARNSFDVIIVFDGQIDDHDGYIMVNNFQYGAKGSYNLRSKQDKPFEIINYDDGTCAVVVPFELIDDSVYEAYPFSDWGSSKGYKVIISQTGKPALEYNFTVKYVNDSYSPYAYYYTAGYLGGFYSAASEYITGSNVGVVTASVLNLRSAPSSDADIVGKLAVGTIVEIVDVDGGWYSVVTSTGQTGYVFAAYVA